MKITGNLDIQVKKNGEIYSNIINNKWQKIEMQDVATILLGIHRIARKRTMSHPFKMTFYKTKINEIQEILRTSGIACTENIMCDKEEHEPFIIRKDLKLILDDLLNFFTEFEFEPNFRFINTLAHALKTSSHKQYISSYFELTDNNNLTAIADKMSSFEFDNIMKDLATYEPTHRINNRLVLYYGSQGTGKTTEAMKEADNNVMVCHSAMLPSDLMEDFEFVDGKANFKPSALQRAIVEGMPIVLDEINLLPFESLRFLQSILDGKTQFTYKGKDIYIAEGFKIYGTMNLVVNGATYALPEPLVDRCQEIRKYKLTSDMLQGAII